MACLFNQLSFFKKAVKSLEEIEPHVKLVTELHHIDYHFHGLEEDDGDDVGNDDDDDENDYDDDSDDVSESLDDGELSFDYGQNDQVNPSTHSMEVCFCPFLQLMWNFMKLFSLF